MGYYKYEPPDVKVSAEYINELCASMIEWSEKEDSLMMPQFLKYKGITNWYLNYFKDKYQKVFLTIEEVKLTLCVRWFNKAMTTKELPPHQSKILMKYLRLYDLETLAIESEDKNNPMIINIPNVERRIEDYSNLEIEEPYNKFYLDNVDKRTDAEDQ